MYLVGKIVGTHGIKGELKVKSDTSFNRFEKGNKLYIDKTQEVTINSHRQHKGMELITINGLKNINDVLEMRVDEAINFFENHSKIYNKLKINVRKEKWRN